jgi:hypothetical protein
MSFIRGHMTTNEHTSQAELRDHMLNVLLALAVCAVILVTGSAISIALDMRALRTAEVHNMNEFGKSALSRFDALLWKVDTITSVVSTTNKDLQNGLLQVRVLVKQNSEDQTKAVKATSNIAKEVVRETLQSNSETLAKVVDQKPAVVNVEVPKPNVPQPAIVVNTPPATHQPTVKIETLQQKPRHSWWVRIFWPWHRD